MNKGDGYGTSVLAECWEKILGVCCSRRSCRLRFRGLPVWLAPELSSKLNFVVCEHDSPPTHQQRIRGLRLGESGSRATVCF